MILITLIIISYFYITHLKIQMNKYEKQRTQLILRDSVLNEQLKFQQQRIDTLQYKIVKQDSIRKHQQLNINIIKQKNEKNINNFMRVSNDSALHMLSNRLPKTSVH